VNVGQNVKRIREEQRYTQTEIARRCGVTPAAISGLEHGDFTPSTPLLVKLARALDVSVEELLEEPAVASLGKAEAPDTGSSALAPWATYARRVAARTRSHTADPHSSAFRDAWAALFFVEERNRDAAELWELLFEEELGWEAYADEPFAALNAVLTALEELAKALAEAQRRAEQMAARFPESEIGQARRRAAKAAAQREQAAARAHRRSEDHERSAFLRSAMRS
jgi:transcriptional regulator with XRE-family HTH domain